MAPLKESLLPLPETPVYQLHLFAPGSGVVWKVEICVGTLPLWAFGFSGSSLVPSWPCTSPSSSTENEDPWSRHMGCCFPEVPLTPVLPEIFSNLRTDCRAQQGLRHPVSTLGPAPKPYHWLTLSGGWVSFAALGHTGEGERKPRPATLLPFLLPHCT